MAYPVSTNQIRVPGQASREGFATVGVASGVVLEANNFRKEAILVNDSNTTIFLAKGPIAALNAGIRLNANGGSYVCEPSTTGRMYTGPISAISSVAAKNLCYTEDW